MPMTTIIATTDNRNYAALHSNISGYWSYGDFYASNNVNNDDNTTTDNHTNNNDNNAVDDYDNHNYYNNCN